jgi:hypothetical protein
MKKHNFTKLYCQIGRALCGCAGGIVGLIAGGPILAIPGILTGMLGGRLLEKQFC